MKAHARWFLLGFFLLVACEQPPQPGGVWTNPEATVRVPLPAGWAPFDGTGHVRYAEQQGRYVVGPMFSRRGGGTIRPRNLSFTVYGLGQVESAESLEELVLAVDARISASFPVILREYEARPGISMFAYRFQHTGAPVSQAAILFMDREQSVFMIEITGHRREEELLLGEGRQILHSIEVANAGSEGARAGPE